MIKMCETKKERQTMFWMLVFSTVFCLGVLVLMELEGNLKRTLDSILMGFGAIGAFIGAVFAGQFSSKDSIEELSQKTMQDLRSVIEKIKACDLTAFYNGQSFKLEVLQYCKIIETFSPTNLINVSVKTLLGNISNMIAALYCLRDDAQYQKSKLFWEKLVNWEDNIRAADQKFDFYVKVRKDLQLLYDKVVLLAEHGGVEITKIPNDSMEYLVYADKPVLDAMFASQKNIQSLKKQHSCS